MTGEVPAVSCLTPSSLPGQLLQDRMGRMSVETPDERSLVLRGKLAPGRYQMMLKTKSGTFPSESLLIELTEWPSRKRVLAGPFDLDHTEYSMVVPTFRVFVDGDDRGLVWAVVSSPEDMEKRRIRAIWGFEADRRAATEIRLEIPPDEERLRWADLRQLDLFLDDRASVPFKASDEGRPRLFTDQLAFERLVGDRDPVQEALLANMRDRLEHGHDGTYIHRPVIAALVGRLTGEERWVKEAIEAIEKMCARPVWGYHDVPEIMGWNNDRDAGMRMFEAAFVYDWLYEHVTEAQRRLMREKMAYHASIAYRTTVLQKGYWYYRTAEAHGHGFWFGFAAAALALADTEPEAQKWLDWIHGNVRDALAHMSEDGISEWLVFNVQWLILTAMLLERALGGRLRGRFPLLRNYSRNIIGFTGPATSVAPLLLYLAGRHRDRRAQADALLAIGLAADGASLAKPRHLHPLALLAYDPTLAPSRPSPARPAAVCSLGGLAMCRGRDPRTRFSFTCGTPLTARQHAAHGWISRAWYQIGHAGSFGWCVGGRTIVPLFVPTYRRDCSNANIITVDGKGHPTHGRWLGFDIPLAKTAWIEHFASGAGVTFCHATASEAFTAEAGVLHRVRRWVYFHDAAVLVLHDTIELDQPRQLAWHLNTTAEPRAAGPNRYALAVKDAAFEVRALHSKVDGNDDLDGLASEVATTQFVPPYTLGINLYKTLDWQPELQTQGKAIPNYVDLQFAPAAAAAKWELITLMGEQTAAIASAESRAVNGDMRIDLGDVGSVCWGSGLVTAGESEIDADMIVRVGDGADYVSFRTRSWRRQGDGVTLAAPEDLVWRPGAGAPRSL